MNKLLPSEVRFVASSELAELQSCLSVRPTTSEPNLDNRSRACAASKPEIQLNCSFRQGWTEPHKAAHLSVCLLFWLPAQVPGSSGQSEFIDRIAWLQVILVRAEPSDVQAGLGALNHLLISRRSKSK